jgi:amino acid adenylation domain-containing protein
VTVTELITRLREQGVRIRATGQELEVDAPEGVLTPELLAELANRKVELLRLLSWSRRSDIATDIHLEPVARDQTLPLSWAQQRLWFLDQLEPDSAAYNISWTVRLTGDLDIAALQSALNRLVARHESLRTVFPSSDGEPVQQVLPELNVPIETESLLDVADEQFRARLGQLAARTFDLAHGPLLRVNLLETHADEHVLLVLIHHIVADGASMRILFRELAQAYEAELAGSFIELPDLPVQYADYAVWQRRWLDGTEQDRQAEFWQAQLAGLPPLLELPWDRPRSAAMRYRGASVLRVLPAGLADQLRKLGREQGCTLFMVMLSAFYVLLMRYSGRTDLVVGTPLGGRPRMELEGLIGFFINTVVLRADLDGDPAFTDLLAEVRNVALDAHAHQELPFEKLVEILKPQRELSYSPIFQVMFDLQEEPRWRLPVKGLEVVPEVVFSSRTSTFDLTLSVRQSESGLDAMFEYDTDLFDEATIERLAWHYQNLLEAVVLEPARRLSHLPLISNEAQQALVDMWAGVTAAYPDSDSLVSLIDARAVVSPDAIALEAVETRLSYAELSARSAALAGYLIGHGVVRGAAVGLCAGRGTDYVLAQLAILKAGAIVVPLDPEYPAARLDFMLADSGAGHLLTDSTADKSLSAVPDGVVALKLAECLAAAAATPNSGLPAPDPDAIAFVLYTSGSTGQPKGVELHHRGLVNYVHQLTNKTALGPGDRVLQFANLSFDIALEECFSALTSGATLVLRRPEMADGMRAFMNGCTQLAVSWLSLPTAWWHELCHELNAGALTLSDSLRVVLIGGEKADTAAFRQWRKNAGTDVRLINTYGPTEASIACTWAELTYLDPDFAGELPIGQPLPNSRVWVLDEHGAPLPAGLPGEIVIGGVGVAHGYRGKPELTRERFGADQLGGKAGELLYRTGDRARYTDAGQLQYLGRLDAQIKLRGHRIEPAEIERVLTAIRGVDAAVVVVHATQSREAQLIAYVQGSRTADELKDELNRVLPAYLLPGAVEVLDALPLTPNGKVDRIGLAAREPVFASSTAYTAPRDANETVLAEIWAAVLRRDAVGIHDNFFELGGHSLLATRVVARVRDVLGIDLPLRELFSNPTIAGLAPRLSQFAEVDRLRPVARYKAADGLPPLSWAQERLWLLDQLEPGNVAYNLPWVARIKGELNFGALNTAINRLVERHAVLRTRFAEQEGEPVQIVAPSQPLNLNTEQLLADQHGDIDVQIRARLRELAEVPFDLHRGPLLRAHLLEIAPGDHVLLLVMHHIVADGWSVGVLCHEMATIYNTLVTGEELALPELAYQYIDYAVWQRNWLAGDELQRQQDYWAEQLTGAPGLLELPADFARPAVQSYQGDWVSARLDKALLDQLKALAAENAASLFMVLLAAFKTLLFRHSGLTDLVVGTSVAGRVRTELEPMVGCFLNTLALRTAVDQRCDFTQLLHDVRRTTLDAYDNQNLPFERLLEVLQPKRSVAHAPLVQVMFNLHNQDSERLELQGLDVESFNIDRDSAKFDLSVAIVEGSADCQIGFEYSTDLFARSTMARMLQHYVTLLETVASEPRTLIGDVLLETPYLPPAVPTHDVQLPAADTSLVAAFGVAVGRFGARLAVETAAHSWSYAELDQHANAVAHSLRKRIAAQDARVGLLLNQDAPMLAALLGTLKAGCVYVPLDRSLPAAKLAELLEYAQLAAVLTVAELRDELPADVPVPVITVDPEETTARSPAATVAADALAYILFTTGSTGAPKGVLQTQRNVLAHIRAYTRALGIKHTDRLTLIPGFGFDAAVMDIFGALLNGACLLPVDVLDVGQRDSPAEAIDALEPTVFHATPTVWRFFMRQAPESFQFATVRAVVLGGEAADARDFELFRKHSSARAIFVNGLGPSESTLATQFIADHDTRIYGGVVPVGLPVAGTQISLADPDSRREVTVVGELLIKSPHVAVSYWQDTELSREKFVPAGDAGCCYYSGDIVRRLPDGQLAYVGRGDGQFKIRGQRAERGSVETALNALPGVSESVVLPVVDARGETLLAAYIVADESVDLEWIHAQLAEALPDFLIPATIERLAVIPLTANGKLDQQALPQPDWTKHSDGLWRAPQTRLEKELADIWQTLLGSESVGVNDDFFRSGGHSLLATQLIARVRSRLSRHVSLKAFFQAPTIAELANLLETLPVSVGDAELRPRPAAASLPPLSWAQQRLWFLDRLDPDTATYNLHWAGRVAGGVDKACLEKALNDLVARHESLRTLFGAGQGGPVQLILPELRVSLQVELLRGAQTDKLKSRVLELIREPFDLERGPLLRCYLLESQPDEAILLLVMPHIIADGWSMGVMFAELAAFYAAHVKGAIADLPALAVQYADYAIWQRQWLSGERLTEQTAFWQSQLAGAPALLELPLDFPRPPVQRYRGAWASRQFAPELLAGLKALADQQGATLFMVLLAVFKVLLLKNTGQQDIVVGTPVAGRRRTELEGLIGFFLNTLALRTQLDGNPTFVDVIARVRQATLDAYEYQDLPFEKLLELLRPPRSTAHSPVVQVMFNLHNEPGGQLRLDDLEVESFPVDRGTAKLDLSAALIESAAGLYVGFEYNTDLFEAETIEQLLEDYAQLLRVAVTAPDSRAATVVFSSAAVAAQARHELPQPGLDETVASRFAAAVDQFGERPAISTPELTLTYAELDALSDRIAEQLVAQTTTDANIGVLLGHDHFAIAGLLACLKAGRPYVPLDSQSPAARLAAIISEAAIELVLTNREHKAVLPEQVAPALLELDALGAGDENIIPAPSPDALAYILFTSGSTGKPKGVMQSQRNLLRQIDIYTHSLGLSATDRLSLFSQYGFDAAVMDIYGALLNGACLHPFDIRNESYSGEILDQMTAAKITILHSTPTVFRLLMRQKVCRHDLESVRTVVLGGEETLSSDFRLFRKQFAPPTRFINGLGPSESTLALQFVATHETRLRGNAVPIGAPVAGVTVRLVDAAGEPAGISGEIEIESDCLALGYWRDPTLTAQRFADAGSSRRRYRTGDLARYLPNGQLVFIGRKDQQIKVRGHRIEPAEIEAVLNDYPGLERCAVLAHQVSTDQLAAPDVRLAAYLVGESDNAELRDYLRNHLPDYMLPQAFVWLAELPLRSNGKLNRDALPDPVWSQLDSGNYVAPRTEVERHLASLWAEVLGVVRVGIHDDFFALGGHSLLAAQLVARITDAMQVGLPLRRLFDAPTVAELAEHVDALQWALRSQDQGRT